MPYYGFLKKIQYELIDGSVILKYPISDKINKKQRKNKLFICITTNLKYAATINSKRVNQLSTERTQTKITFYFIITIFQINTCKYEFAWVQRRTKPLQFKHPVKRRTTLVDSSKYSSYTLYIANKYIIQHNTERIVLIGKSVL